MIIDGVHMRGITRATAERRRNETVTMPPATEDQGGVKPRAPRFGAQRQVSLDPDPLATGTSEHLPNGSFLRCRGVKRPLVACDPGRRASVRVRPVTS